MSTTKSLRLFTFLLGVLTSVSLLMSPLVGQEKNDSIVIGKWQEIESKILGETRRIIVGLPDDYESVDKKYPVLYLLDGPAHFHHTTGLVDFLSGNDLAPDMIVVAVANTDRTRDMTPPDSESNPMRSPNGGGANNFIRFFDEELVPHIDGKYRTHDFKILVGHSYGGLFAVHTLVHKPDLFDAYVAISPSFQWDNQKLVQQANEFFQKTDSLKKSLYMTSGSEGNGLTGGVLKMAGILTEHAPNGFNWNQRIMNEESHNSVVYRSTRQGLEFVFKDWALRDPVALYDRGGMKAVHGFYENSSDRYGIKRKASPNTIRRLCFRLGMQDRLDDAVAVIQDDPEKYPPTARLYQFLGDKCKAKGKTKLAIECFTQALKLAPTSETTKKSLADLGVEVSKLEKDKQ